jgi:hypothetical protein
MNQVVENTRKYTRLSNHILTARQPFWLMVIAGTSVTSIFLWRVLSQFGTALIGQDSSFAIWSLWWPSRALWFNQDVMVTDYAVFPFQQNLLLALSPLGSVLYALLKLLQLSPPLVFNFLYCVSIVFTGWATLIYLLHSRVPKVVAFFCALLLVCSPIVHYRLFQGRPDLMAIGWIPLGCLAWDWIRLGQRRSFWLAAVLIGSTLTSLQVTLIGLVVWVPYIAFSILKSKLDEWRTLIDQLLLQLLIVLIVWMAYPLPGILKTLARLVPSPEPKVLLPSNWQPSIGTVLLAILWIGLLAISFWSGKSFKIAGNNSDRLIWLGIALLGLIFAAIQQIGGFAVDQPELLTTADWFVPISVAFCMFTGLSLTPLWQSWRQSRRAIRLGLFPVLLLVAAIALQAPPPTVPWNPTSAYSLIGKEPGDYAVLEIPFGIHALGDGHSFGNGAPFQQYAIVHHKRTLNGSTTNSNPGIFDTFMKSPLFKYLADADSVPKDKAVEELQKVINQYQIGYLIVQFASLKPAQQESVLNFLNTQAPSLCRVFLDSTTGVYRTSWHPLDCKQELR